MKTVQQEICTRFIQNRDTLKAALKLENNTIYPVCAAQITGRGRTVEPERLTLAKRTLKQETSVFSNFRGNAELPTICALAVSEDPQSRMEQTTDMYRRLREEFHGSTYLALAAVLLPELAHGVQAQPYLQRGKQLYRLMKAEHPFLTSSEDSVMAILLAFSEKSDEQLIADMEEVYSYLKDRISWSSSESMQTVSHILAMGSRRPMDLAERFLQLFTSLRENGHSYGRDYQLTALAVLAISRQDTGSLLENILATDDFLKEQKGYKGIFDFDRKTRLMHAAMLVSLMDEENAVPDAGILTSTLVMVAAQQAAICAMIACSAASSSAASS